MVFFITFIDFILHLDTHLIWLFQNYGLWLYAILFLIIFAETGLVATPFLPGDSLLFAVGALAGTGSLNILLLWGILAFAAVAGDTANYWIGYSLGPKSLKSKNDNILKRFLKKEYIERTEKFYAKYGNKTIILARFVPIVRTFAPFMAGVGSMRYSRFIAYNLIGGVVWVSVMLFGGYFFGNIAAVKRNFSLVILGIIILSFVPVLVEYLKHRRERSEQGIAHKS
ncbi:DedA family protein [Candidatus Woesearchaeota archaeon]|nr:DedA family protein [Candidatus Woesearchaeota archaeon]